MTPIDINRWTDISVTTRHNCQKIEKKFNKKREWKKMLKTPRISLFESSVEMIHVGADQNEFGWK